MRCPLCKVDMVKIEAGEMELKVGGRLYLVRNVSYEECPLCGERVISPEVSQRLYEKIKRGEYREEQLVLPVLDGAS